MSFLEIIGVIALVYLVIALIARHTQEYFLFHPEKLPLDFKYRFEYPFTEVYLDVDGATVNGLHFKVPNSRGVVYYFKGNTRSVKGWGKYARDFLSKGYDLFMFDYRGFGKSSGRRSEELFYEDAQAGYDYLLRFYEEGEIVLYGRSIGSGFAANTAASNNPRMLILDSPYKSLYHIVRYYTPFLPVASILRYQVRTDLYIPNVKCPIYIIHGERDRLIPFRHSIDLSRRNDLVHLIKIKKAGHNNLPDHADYHHILYEILNGQYEELGLFDELY